MLKNAPVGGTGRMNQKARTRTAIIEACRALIQTGATITMPDVARRALVSEATAYRYFPDIVTLIIEAHADLWPSPNEALPSLAASADPLERIAVTSEVFLRRILTYQGAVRTMIAATITRQGGGALRPSLHFTWIEYALAPAGVPLVPIDAEMFARLKRDLAVAVSPEALFMLIDFCGLSSDEAVTNAVRLATTITAAALQSSR